ncbi:hypothetical protein AB0F91_45740 [Amycolatopsis sp. NPDC023774]|uniref:hypothetical protein n=1 Tax=Amycolatopsis sp. NPDC023774 TaxID=3155015 RepID=UPI003409F45E
MLTDHDGRSGAVRFAETGWHLVIRTGAELSLELPAPQGGTAEPLGSHLSPSPAI